ncbi:MAG TPA: biotin/lipoyl-containing protein [Gemmatimonadaceae bacterium]
MKYVVTLNGRDVELSRDGATVEVDGGEVAASVADVEGTPVRLVRVGDTVHRVIARREGGRGRYTLWVDGWRFDAEALDERARAIRELSAATAGATGPAPLKAPMPGLIVRVNVQPGDAVQPGQGLVVMEAMKMENELKASAAGRVKSVLVAPGTAVEKGALLVELE